MPGTLYLVSVVVTYATAETRPLTSNQSQLSTPYDGILIEICHHV